MANEWIKLPFSMSEGNSVGEFVITTVKLYPRDILRKNEALLLSCSRDVHEKFPGYSSC